MSRNWPKWQTLHIFIANINLNCVNYTFYICVFAPGALLTLWWFSLTKNLRVVKILRCRKNQTSYPQKLEDQEIDPNQSYSVCLTLKSCSNCVISNLCFFVFARGALQDLWWWSLTNNLRVVKFFDAENYRPRVHKTQIEENSPKRHILYSFMS